MRAAGLRKEMEMLAGVLPDMEAEEFENNVKLLSTEMDALFLTERSVERERELTKLHNQAQKLLNDYLGNA